MINSTKESSSSSSSSKVDTGGGGRQNAHLALCRDKLSSKYDNAEQHHQRYTHLIVSIIPSCFSNKHTLLTSLTHKMYMI